MFCLIPHVLFLTVHHSTLVPVDYPTPLQDGVSIFWVYHEVPDGVASSEMHFNPMFSADVLAAFTHVFEGVDSTELCRQVVVTVPVQVQVCMCGLSIY